MVVCSSVTSVWSATLTIVVSKTTASPPTMTTMAVRFKVA